MADVEAAHAEPQSRHIVYCGVCSLPPEYCEFGGTVKKCQDWLESHHPETYERLWSADALEAATSALSLDAQKRAAKDSAKKAARALAAEEKQASARASSRVQIRRVERGRRKYVTAVVGLELFGLELKRVAKDLGRKFATGSSVTRTPAGGEEIVVQGDVSEEIEEFLLERFGEAIPEESVELVEDKKKKGSGAGG